MKSRYGWHQRGTLSRWAPARKLLLSLSIFVAPIDVMVGGM